MFLEPTKIRSELLRLDKYARPKDNGQKESFPEVIKRVVWDHQRWLWERALKRSLRPSEHNELVELERLMLRRELSCAGRTLFLGGTELSKEKEITQFNCAFLNVQTVRDVVDFYWNLLNGCGVGAELDLGLTGFKRKIKTEVIRSTREYKGGNEYNIEHWDYVTKKWTIIVGDSAEAWAKFIGKILAHPYPAETLILDFSQVRPAGIRLSRYGWISSGDSELFTATLAIVEILNKRTGKFLSKINVMDILNWLGTTLSSRRSAEIMIMNYDDVESKDFLIAKNDTDNNVQRYQSNNSFKFYRKPTYKELSGILNTTLSKGEPTLINASSALKRAFWFKGLNPCGETLLMSQSLCNLLEINQTAFIGRFEDFKSAVWLGARANYRQTLVNLEDGMLQENWHRQNEFLRLCGLGLTGIQGNLISTNSLIELRQTAHQAADYMASEVGTLPSKAITLVKPSGTLSKVIFNGIPEGIHYLPYKYVFNNINVSINNQTALTALVKAGFNIRDNPISPTSKLVTLPIDNTKYYQKMPSAVKQLDDYKKYLKHWCDHNVSMTVSIYKKEIPEIIQWMNKNWDSYLSVAFLPHQDENVEYSYMPQQIVDETTFKDYVSKLKSIKIEDLQNIEMDVSDCENGCPVN